MKQILLVEDDKYFAEMLIPYLEEKGYGVDTAENGIQAIKMLALGGYHIVLLDINLPEVNGKEILNLVKMQKTHPKVIVITGEEDANLKKQVILQGADDYLEKPIDVRTLVKALEKDNQTRGENS